MIYLSNFLRHVQPDCYCNNEAAVRPRFSTILSDATAQSTFHSSDEPGKSVR